MSTYNGELSPYRYCPGGYDPRLCLSYNPPNGTVYRWSWRIPLGRGTHTLVIEVRDSSIDNLAARVRFTVEVRNQFARRVTDMRATLAAADQELAGLEVGFHPLGVNVGPLVERLRGVRAEAKSTLADVLPLGSVAVDVEAELIGIALEAQGMADRATNLSAASTTTAIGLWASVAALGAGSTALFLALRRRRRPA